MTSPSRISVVGLGYVGLPLTIALARHFDVVGYDHDAVRIAELRAGHDRTREVAPAVLASTTAALADDPAAMAGSDVFAIAVPTPVDERREPDLGALIGASRSAVMAWNESM